MGFAMFEIVFFMMFILVFGIILFGVVRSISQWNKNNHSPRLTVMARVVSRRTAVSAHHTGAGAGSAVHHTTSYYVTFEVESGDRMELSLSGTEYGMIAEGDMGTLTFQGTRFLSFERKQTF